MKMIELITKKIMELETEYDYYLEKSEKEESEYLFGRLIEIRAKIRVLEEVLNESKNLC